MMRLHLSSKGQLTFPKELCDWIGVKPGGDIAVEIAKGGKILLRPPQSAAGLLAKYARPIDDETEQETQQLIGENLGALDERIRRRS